MEIANPNQNKPYNRLIKDKQGNDLYGVRNEGTNDEEIVHIPTNQSNTKYYQPEKVLDPEGCNHSFHLTSIGRREIECIHCKFATTFHPVHSFVDDRYVLVNNQKYLLNK